MSQTHFPCLDKHSKRQDELKSTTQRAMEGPEPNYAKVVSGYDTFTYTKPFKFQHGGQLLHGYQIAYETWGQLNADRTNAILLHTGLSVPLSATVTRNQSMKIDVSCRLRRMQSLATRTSQVDGGNSLSGQA